MESLNLTRQHAPLGRDFSAEAEAVADLMMQRPVYTADELEFNAIGGDGIKGERATIRLPNGDLVSGYISSRGPSGVHAELLFAIMGADVGAPTAPYLYIKDRGVVFSPLPFDNARAVDRDTCRHDMGSQSHLQRLTNPTTLGAIEPFVRLVNKTDDHRHNRVYAEGGRAALIDNAITAFGSITKSIKRRVRGARARCRFGARHAAYHTARIEMASRIENYDEARLAKIDEYLSNVLGIYVPDIARGVRNRKHRVGDLRL